MLFSKIRNRGIYILSFSLVFLTSCDFFSTGSIKNESSEDVVLVAILDTNITKHYLASTTDFLKSYANDTSCIMISMDTTKYIGFYKLKSKGSVITDFSNSKTMTTKFCYLQIRKSHDTITYHSNKELSNAFIMNIEPGHNKLIIR